jgi:hypothetical protein
MSMGDGTFVKQSNVSRQDGTPVGYRTSFADFNGDGIANVFWDQVDSNEVSTGSRVL